MDKATKQKIIQDYSRSEKDCGSSEVQIAVMTHRINELTQHCRANPRDHNTRRGLLTLVNKRRKLLQYLNTKDHPRYLDLIKRLKLRR